MISPLFLRVMANTATISVANDNGESIRVIANMGDQPPRIRQDLPIEDPHPTPAEGWAMQRLPALIFFIVSTGLAILSMSRGMDPRETGILAGISGVSALCLLFSLPRDRQFLRGGLAICGGLFACTAAILILPAYDLWPQKAEIAIFSGIYLLIALVTRSRVCVAIALGLIAAQLAESNGLLGLPTPTRNGLLALLVCSIGIAIYVGSRSMAAASVLAMAVAGLSVLAIVGLPAASALAILAIIAASLALIFRSALRANVEAADAPMLGAAIVAGLAAIGLQLILTAETGPETLLFGDNAPNWTFPLLVVAQAMAAIVSLHDAAKGGGTYVEVGFQQLAFTAAIGLTLFPIQFEDLTGYAASTALIALFALALLSVSLLALFRSWRADKPILMSIVVLFIMAQVFVGVRYVSGDFDLGVAGMVCAGVAFSLAVIMAIAPRRLAETLPTTEKANVQPVS